MSTRGKAYPCPLGHRIQSRSRGPRHQSAASKRLAKLKAAEDNFCFQECKNLANGISDPPQYKKTLTDLSAPEPTNDSTSDIDDPFEPLHQPSNQHDVHNLNTEPQNTPNYADRRLQEEARWTSVISSMFVEYMRCKALTMNWGHLLNWNNDWKDECHCPSSVQRTRHVDSVDLLSRFLESLLHFSLVRKNIT